MAREMVGCPNLIIIIATANIMVSSIICMMRLYHSEMPNVVGAYFLCPEKKKL